jgi:pimeloyl-ACP methyl ester carboxylesterase
MQFTSEEMQLLNSALALLERIPSITTSEYDFAERKFLVEELIPRITHELLASSNPDLADIGLYILSHSPVQFPNSIELSRRISSPKSAENIARYLVAMLSPEEVSSWFRIMPTRVRQSLGASLEAAIIKSTLVAGGTPKKLSVGDMTIIVHGTWARTQSWWQPGGSFWNYIQSKVGNVYGGSDAFSWSGGNWHSSRMTAATELVAWAQAHPATNLDIIAHNHGGNVALLASHEGLNIRKLINLGTPIRTEYLPNLRNINSIHNVFSTWDFVQTPAGTKPNQRGEGRTLADSERIVNHRAVDDGTGSDPDHSQLHEESTWQVSDLERLL